MLVTGVLTYRHNCWSVADELFVHFWPNHYNELHEKQDNDDEKREIGEKVECDNIMIMKIMSMMTMMITHRLVMLCSEHCCRILVWNIWWTHIRVGY